MTLLAHGVYVTGRSPKYHRPRGVFCGRGSCGQCIARVDGLPNQRICLTPSREGTRVESQNVVGTARFDLLGTIDWIFPAGIDHHRLMTESSTLNRVAIAMARELSGLGELPAEKMPFNVPEPDVREIDVAVVGGGSSGQAAARMASGAGLHVLMIDPNAETTTTVLGGMRVVGFYDDRGLLAVGANGMTEVRARAIVLATGAYEQLPPCPGNDMPGVFGRRAVETALDAGILPGHRVALAVDPAADESTRRRAVGLAERLVEGGAHLEVALGLGGDVGAHRCIDDAVLGGVEGRSRVRRVRISGGHEAYDCDAVVWCARPVPAYELARLMGVETPYDPAVGGFVPIHDKDGATARDALYVTGELAGVDADAAAAHGAVVGAAVTNCLRPANGAA